MSVAGASLGPDATGRRLETEAGRIVAVEEAGAGDGRLLPGRINAHTHVYSGLAPFGMPPPAEPPRDFPEILERVWWRLDRALDAASLAAAARWYAAEALAAGTTTLVDHHESPELIEGSLDILAEACQEVGIRAVLCYGATERNGGREEGRRGLGECRRFLLENDRPLVRGVVGLHASFTVSDETAREAGELAREHGTVVHVHLAEDVVDVEDARRRGWPGPLERLLGLGALPRGSILAHGVHLERDQVERCREAGLWLVQNPRSNRGNRVGYARYLVASDRVALGTDGYPSDLDEERAALVEEAAAHGEDEASIERKVRGSHHLLAERFGLPFAPLAPGAAADAVHVVDDAVDAVMVAGRRVVTGGALTTADHSAIRAEAERRAPELWRRMEAVRAADASRGAR